MLACAACAVVAVLGTVSAAAGPTPTARGAVAADPGSGGQATYPARPAGRKDGPSRLDSSLAPIAETAAEKGARPALALARARGVDVDSGAVRVVVEAKAGAKAAAASSVESVGGDVEATSANLVQALVEPAELEKLAASKGVRLVRQPLMFVPQATVDEAVQTSGAAQLQAQGIDGAGVKVAIIDFGFAGLAAAIASGDLPGNVVTQDYCGGRFNTATEHGTAVAAAVHKMAPGAQLYLICIDSEVTLGQAEAYAKANGIRIVNHSAGWLNSSRGDGSGGPGSPDAIVADARANGILWINSAGNEGETHWSGTFSSPTPGPQSGNHQFSESDQGETFTLAAGKLVCAALRWDDWPLSDQNYDLYLQVAGSIRVASSDVVQDGSKRPTEGLCYRNNTASTQEYDLVINRSYATEAPRFDLFVEFIDGGGSAIQYAVAAGSITDPASSPSALAVGAVCWQSGALEAYSSQGPTVDGRTKPDLVAEDSTSSPVYGPFTGCGASLFPGTSASAAHVAGAAALLAQTHPGVGPAELQSLLQSYARDLGTPGADNLYGHGRLFGTAGVTVARAGTGTGTVTGSPAGVSCGSTCAFDYVLGGTVTLTATPAGNATFDGWSGACSNATGPCTVAVDGAKDVTAVFTQVAPPPTLSVALTGTGSGTVTSSPAGISCGTTCAAQFTPGTPVTLTAAAGPGSTFMGWGGPCAGTGACLVTMDAAVLVTASFAFTATAPGAPTAVSGLPGIGRATVSFTAPASTGGIPITSYTVTASPGGATASGPSSPIAVTGLATGTPYTFTVTATNAVGTGPPSVSSGQVTPTAAAIYWANSATNAIGAATLDGSVLSQSIVGSAGTPGAVAVDGTHLFWTSTATGAIGRANLDGTAPAAAFIGPGGAAWGIAVDGAHVYWTNEQGNTIGRANLDGTGVNASFITGANHPYGVAVDHAHVYWTNEQGNTIGRANLDGTGVTQSFVTGATHPSAVAVDDRHVYWANGAQGIGRADLDGTDVDQDYLPGGNPFGLAVAGERLYWASPNADTPGASTVGRADADGSHAEPAFIGASGLPRGVAVQPTVFERPTAELEPPPAVPRAVIPDLPPLGPRVPPPGH